MQDPIKRPKIKRPQAAIPWTFVTVVVVGMLAMAVFGSWGYVAFQ